MKPAEVADESSRRGTTTGGKVGRRLTQGYPAPLPVRGRAAVSRAADTHPHCAPGAPSIYEVKAIEERKERAVLVGLNPSPTLEDSLDELALLAQTAGAEVVERVRQRKESISPGMFVSKGKLATLEKMVEDDAIDFVIFDDDLSPGQGKNLESKLKIKVVDRSELILAIFAEHARTRESRLQVELAQLEYLLPRLTRMWVHLSRQQGGIGTRGPGETQLEVDRRRVREKIAFLKKKLEDVERERTVQRARRENVHRTALVGYTNAGKSTLMNAMTGAGVLAEDKLFATLDATTRRYRYPDGLVTLLTDTVGFIRKLPHHLVASFRSTLKEVIDADLLLHVVDAASPSAHEQIEAVQRVLVELEVADKPSILVLNQMDRAEEVQLAGLRVQYPNTVTCSAKTKEGLDDLLAAVHDAARTSVRMIP